MYKPPRVGDPYVATWLRYFGHSTKSGRCNVRLTVDEQNAIRQVIHRFDPLACIWLFGSRVDDQARGGDIDLLILSDKLDHSDKMSIRLALYEHIGEQKIDLVIAADDSDPFTRIALVEVVPL